MVRFFRFDCNQLNRPQKNIVKDVFLIIVLTFYFIASLTAVYVFSTGRMVKWKRLLVKYKFFYLETERPGNLAKQLLDSFVPKVPSWPKW